jgi:hypothetical protein
MAAFGTSQSDDRRLIGRLWRYVYFAEFLMIRCRFVLAPVVVRGQPCPFSFLLPKMLQREDDRTL